MNHEPPHPPARELRPTLFELEILPPAPERGGTRRIATDDRPKPRRRRPDPKPPPISWPLARVARIAPPRIRLEPAPDQG